MKFMILGFFTIFRTFNSFFGSSECAKRDSFWYDVTHMTVNIKWNIIGKSINVCKGIRQGGLTSPFIFNAFYKDLIDDLASQEGGLTICGNKFNVYCYADDILLSSSTVTGLQGLIDTAVRYVSLHGLRFGPGKSVCVINGENPFTSDPQWFAAEEKIKIKPIMEYLGAMIGNNGCHHHVENRASKCRKAYFDLQGAGLCNDGLNIKTATRVWTATCEAILSYGCSSLFFDRSCKTTLDKTQAKYVKC